MQINDKEKLPHSGLDFNEEIKFKKNVIFTKDSLTDNFMKL